MTTEPSWVPAGACFLPTVEQPLRLAELDALVADHLTGVERHDETPARLLLTGGAEVVARARDLADRETACCSFFAFAVVEDDDGPRLDVAVPAAQAAVLEALVARAESVRGRVGP